MIGTLYIVSAPSGGGKTSLVNALLQSVSDLEVSVSYTTRPKRPGEEEGVNYHFIDEVRFNQLITDQIFLEYAQVFGCFYGTSRQWVEEKLRAGIDVILEIDWQGAQQIRTLLPEVVSIFILPPSQQILEQRLRARAQDNEQVIARRMAQARTEMSHCYEYDYWVVNDDFKQAIADLEVIMRARRLRQGAQKLKHTNLVANLLASNNL